MPQKIIVTTSPWKDNKTGKWKLSAFMGIQLDAGVNTTLSAFPDVLKWIEKLQQAVFFVQFNNEAPKEIKPITKKWDAALYAKLFESKIKVDSFQPLNISKLVLKSYPAMHINNFILDTYKEVGSLKADVLPDTNFFINDWKKLNEVSNVQLTQTKPLTGRKNDATTNDFLKRGHAGKEMVRATTAQNKFIPFSAQANTNMDFGQFYNYHAKDVNKRISQLAKIPQPQFEYHDVLSIITSYPAIMRKLGLVIDFELPGNPSAANGTVRIIPSNLGFENEVQVSSPATAYQATANGFYAAAKPGSFIDKGMLKINTPDFSVIQIDTDGAAMKLASHAETIHFTAAENLVLASNFINFVNIDDKNAGKQNAPKKEEPKEDIINEGLPALRSAGIGLVKNGLAEILYKKLNRNTTLHNTVTNVAAAVNSTALMNKGVAGAKKEVTTATRKQLKDAVTIAVNIPLAAEILYVDDLVQGYRMDIAYEDNPTKWHSLHKRKNTYAFVPVGGAEQQINLNGEDEIDESCIHLTLTKDELQEGDDDKINEVMARWEGWSLAVPRPGKGLNNEGTEISSDEEEKKKYKLNNEVPFRLQVYTKPAPKTLPMLRFGKSYRVRIRTVDIAGNGLQLDSPVENEAAVIKTGIKYLRYEPLPVPVLIQGDEVTGGDKNKMRDRDGESIEHMVIRSNYNVNAEPYEKNNPTTVYKANTETNDNSKKTIPVTTLTYLHEAVRHVAAPRSAQHTAELHGMFDGAIKDAAKAAEAYTFITSRDIETKDDGKTKAAVKPVTDVNVPVTYLADPLAAGVVFTMKSDTNFETSWKKGETKKISFYFDDEVSDANADTVYTSDQWRNPKSFRIKLIEGNAAPAWDKGSRQLIIALPKAAQIEINYASFWRPSDLDKLSGMQQVITRGGNARSMQMVKKSSHWMTSPWRTIRLVHAVQQPLEKPVLIKEATNVLRNYNDTFVTIPTKINIHGSSTDKVDMEANWKEWVDDLNDEAPKQIDGKTHVDTVPVSYTDKILDLSIQTKMMSTSFDLLPLNHVFGDTKHRMVNYSPVAATRYREYFTGIFDTAVKNGKTVLQTQTGEAVQLNILSSARPTIPVIDYVVPSFNWLKTKAGNIDTHLRTGNIRVYLKRPWYSSGDDEKIAVILPSKGVMQKSIQEKYCTVWGKDPAFVAPDLNNSNYPVQEHFPNAEAYKKLGFDKFPLAAEYDTVHLAEENDTVSIAAFTVLFDKEKQLHYADIPVFIAFAYFPFVKLSLARYQRNSLRQNETDCCLSNTVQTDWIQVVPARATALMPLKGSPNIYDVVVRGTPAGVTPGQAMLKAVNNGSVKVKITITVENTSIPKSDEAFISVNDRGQGLKTTEYIKQTELNDTHFKNGQIEFIERITVNSGGAKIVIREYELHEADPIRAHAKQKSNAFGQPNYQPEYAERLVFMDVYELGG